jgi:flagellar protein FlaG
MDIPAVTSQNLPLHIAGPTGVPTPEVEDRRELIHAVRAINAAELYGQEHELAFAVDRESRRAVVRIVDRKTRAVVDQIPSEQVLRLAEELKQQH